MWFGALQKLAKPAEDGHKSLQKFSIVGASWFLLTPHISAWPYLVGLDMEVDSCQLEDFDFYLFSQYVACSKTRPYGVALILQDFIL